MCKENHIFPQHAPICENFRLCALLSETFYNKVRKASLSLAQQFEFAQLYNKFALMIAQKKAAPFKSRNFFRRRIDEKIRELI